MENSARSCDCRVVFLSRQRPLLWWEIDSSVSEPEIFLPQLPYNERCRVNQGFTLPLMRPLTEMLA